MQITDLEIFLKGIQEKKPYPEGLKLDLYNSRIGNEKTKAIAMALQSRHCPQGLQLYLGRNQLGVEETKVIAMALQSGHCPQGLKLDLRFNEIGVEGEKILEEVEKGWRAYYADQQE